LNIFIRSGDIRRRTSKSAEIGSNFAGFWPLKIFWGGSLKISARDYKIERSIEHRAKFCADRPTELGDYAAKKQQNLSPLRKLSLAGGLKNTKQ